MGKLCWYKQGWGKCAELAQTEVSEGGWYNGRSWLTDKAIQEANQRWAMRSYDTRADKHIDEDILPHYELGCFQCGGCKFAAMSGADFGICWNKDSPLDGCIIFEHGGCVKHSSLVKLMSEVMDE